MCLVPNLLTMFMQIRLEVILQFKYTGHHNANSRQDAAKMGGWCCGRLLPGSRLDMPHIRDIRGPINTDYF